MRRSTQPNILLLHTDQQRFDTIAALGASHMRTPNLDRLVGRGVSFLRAYSSCPVCQPARHDLITGASARHHGYYGNRPGPIADYGMPTIPRLLTESGYRTMAVGKMHFWPQRTHHGFERLFLMEELPECLENDEYLRYLKERGFGNIRCQHGVRPLFYHTPQASRVPEEHHGSAWVATKTIELLRERRNRPFFIFSSWVGPHPPYYVPGQYLDMYRETAIPRPCASTISSERQAPVSPENPEPDSERIHRICEAYYAAITFIDVQIGRILDELDAQGLSENTVILFTSDHGEMLGDLGLYQKNLPYEGSAHIPLIVVGGGFEPGTRCEKAVSTWDTAATILEVSGVPSPTGHPLVGESLRGLCRGGDDRIVVFHHGSGSRRFVASVGGGHKFIHWYNGGQEELYDLVSDPREQDNIIGKIGDSASDALRSACLRFERIHGDSACVGNAAFLDKSYVHPARNISSLHPEWANGQLPPWPERFTAEDLSFIENEMKDCAKNSAAYIFGEPAWRENAIREWEAIGGKRKAYLELFESVGTHL